jgi:hypothetical protein
LNGVPIFGGEGILNKEPMKPGRRVFSLFSDSWFHGFLIQPSYSGLNVPDLVQNTDLRVVEEGISNDALALPPVLLCLEFSKQLEGKSLNFAPLRLCALALPSELQRSFR